MGIPFGWARHSHHHFPKNQMGSANVVAPPEYRLA
jgi:hypothetical protein